MTVIRFSGGDGSSKRPSPSIDCFIGDLPRKIGIVGIGAARYNAEARFARIRMDWQVADGRTIREEILVLRMVVQARMGSTRLPGKILAPLAGEPLLGHVVRRLKAAIKWLPISAELVIATTTNSEDDATAAWCRREQIVCLRGPTDDVLARYVLAVSDLNEHDLVVRATADNPAYCPLRTCAIVQRHIDRQVDYTCIRDLSYVVPEVMTVAALRRLECWASDPYAREHVTPGFRREPAPFQIEQLEPTWMGLRPEIRFTVDNPAEQIFVGGILERLIGEHGPEYPLESAYELATGGEVRIAEVANG